MNQQFQVPSWVLLILVVLGMIFCMNIALSVVGYLAKASVEARYQNKQIEFGSLVAGASAVLVALATLVYSVFQVDALSKRVSRLEHPTDVKSEPPVPPSEIGR